MILLLVLVVAVVWIVTVRDVVRRRELTVGRRATWVLATLLLPLFAVPVYWLIKPQRRPPAVVPLAPAARVQTMADLIPGWSPELPGACEQANAWAGSESRVAPDPSFYSWLRESGIAERYPACAAKLLRTLLGTERRPSFPACPEIGALTRLLEQYVMDGDDLRAVKEQLQRLCPGMPSPDPRGTGRPAHAAFG
jgi:Phospholipase_D-nuclease N-terminal